MSSRPDVAMKVVTAAQMREIDRVAIHEVGVPGCSLMENAGYALARQAEELLGEVLHRVVWIYCGKGNNGGDGLVAARHLCNAGAMVEVVMVDGADALSTEAALQFGILGKMELSCELFTEDKRVRGGPPDLVIDALLGTGIRGPARGDYLAAIREINELPAPVVSADIPSGANADEGELQADVVVATCTVAMGLAKVGMFFQPLRPHTGELRVVPIGFPA
ncbi:MAG: NAD(P)H-hydrate epimerase, partial [Planctomycetes bacterium]|nr:NAD(P)H-hydrate epimerase [Planctomycetota bacterium]